ncbi:MAG: peptidase M17 [Thermoplasmata archaeon]|nr:MAG: peptidase M17 [Thermoplasmata archaeon]
MAKKKLGGRKLDRAASVAVRDILGVKKGERVLIVTNPEPDVEVISRALYKQTEDAGGAPLLVIQPVKGQLDYADPAVISALHSRPEVVLSISHEKLGKDREAMAKPIRVKHRGKLRYKKYFHVFDYLLTEGKCRSFWSPGVTVDMFTRTVPIDYSLLQRRAAKLGSALSRGAEVLISAPGGTDLTIGIGGRKARKDDGNFRKQGSGGNVPAGEVFISPELGTSRGTIAFDGSISSEKGEIIIKRPIECRVEDGFVVKVSGGGEARSLRGTLKRSVKKAESMVKDGAIPAARGKEFAKNAYNLGELGIGLNPAARIVGNMLEDEKAFRTCHIAIGSNYDNDAEALTHLDGLIKEPTIRVRYPSGMERLLLEDGSLI